MTMKNLLERCFISHYGLTASVSVNVRSTNDADFDLKDDEVLIYPPGHGVAKYENPTRKEINVINYDLFITSLPTKFQQGREKCDLIAYTSDSSCFLLNELTETQLRYIAEFTLADGTPKTGKRKKAISQLKRTLKDIATVPAIGSFIKQHSIKRCCFFNKPPLSPAGIIATIAFNRLSFTKPHGFKMSNADIENFGFEIWEFSANQTYLLSSSE
jgi:hypothetical protein